ncbi:DinB family protein [Microlunatus elymi]|uniref:DinB family protein n=1 Tax=Microlunatus elymi TaxID=2596828 RepID=A0A516Q3L8_9ACTN|nr:DinB family protein [Microlunatus elymi]QDP98023.1 DinB family protein [Microlunatus elymi]
MSDIEALRALVSDAFSRVQELVDQITRDLSEAQATYRPDDHANSIAWLVWHASRVQDDHVADLAGVDQAWPAWREKFGLPFDDWATGYGQSAEEVGEVQVSGELLAGYYHDVQGLTGRYLGGLTEAELDRIVDDNWDPPVTASVRLVSVIGDITQHLGQAFYVKGLAQRAGIH